MTVPPHPSKPNWTRQLPRKPIYANSPVRLKKRRNVCANWNDDAAIPTVALLEKLSPGLVASSVDAYGHDALWYTLYQRDARGIATPAARRKIDPLDAKLIELGCDPARACFLGLSWQDVAERREDVDGI